MVDETGLILAALERLDGKIVVLDGKLDRLDLRFEQVDARFDQVDLRFAQVDARFDQVDLRFGQVDARFDQVDRRFEQVDARLDQLDRRIDLLDGRVEQLGRLYELLDGRVERLETGLVPPGLTSWSGSIGFRRRSTEHATMSWSISAPRIAWNGSPVPRLRTSANSVTPSVRCNAESCASKPMLER